MGKDIQQRERSRGAMGRRRTHHPTKGNKTGWEADAPSNERNKKGHNGRQREKRPLGRRTHHPVKGNKNGYNGRLGETRPLGRHLDKALNYPNNTQFEEQEGAQWETKGNKILGKDTPSNQGKQERIQWETKGDQRIYMLEVTTNRIDDLIPFLVLFSD